MGMLSCPNDFPFNTLVVTCPGYVLSLGQLPLCAVIAGPLDQLNLCVVWPCSVAFPCCGPFRLRDRFPNDPDPAFFFL